jgi:hypothetical protein
MTCRSYTLHLPPRPRYTAITFVAMDITLLMQMCILARVAAKRATSVMVELPTSALPPTTTRTGYGAIPTVALLALGTPLQFFCFQWSLPETVASTRGSSRYVPQQDRARFDRRARTVCRHACTPIYARTQDAHTSTHNTLAYGCPHQCADRGGWSEAMRLHRREQRRGSLRPSSCRFHAELVLGGFVPLQPDPPDPQEL